MPSSMAFLVIRSRFLEAVASTDNNATIGEAFVTQQSAFIDTILINFFLSDVNGFKPDVEFIGDIIIYAGIELPSIIVNNGETPWRAGSTDIVV